MWYITQGERLESPAASRRGVGSPWQQQRLRKGKKSEWRKGKLGSSRPALEAVSSHTLINGWTQQKVLACNNAHSLLSHVWFHLHWVVCLWSAASLPFTKSWFEGKGKAKDRARFAQWKLKAKQKKEKRCLANRPQCKTKRTCILHDAGNL